MRRVRREEARLAGARFAFFAGARLVRRFTSTDAEDMPRATGCGGTPADSRGERLRELERRREAARFGEAERLGERRRREERLRERRAAISSVSTSRAA